MLIYLNSLADDILLGLYRIGKGREEEKRGEQELLVEMLCSEVELSHNEDGKPLVEGYHISISHTKGYVAIILSQKHQVGIDIEYRSERVKRISKRFLRSDEHFTETEDLLTVWCVKETIYKLFSEDHLTYQDMKVDIQKKIATNLMKSRDVTFVIASTHEYILTYAWL